MSEVEPFEMYFYLFICVNIHRYAFLCVCAQECVLVYTCISVSRPEADIRYFPRQDLSLSLELTGLARQITNHKPSSGIPGTPQRWLFTWVLGSRLRF